MNKPFLPTLPTSPTLPTLPTLSTLPTLPTFQISLKHRTRGTGNLAKKITIYVRHTIVMLFRHGSATIILQNVYNAQINRIFCDFHLSQCSFMTRTIH